MPHFQEISRQGCRFGLAIVFLLIMLSETACGKIGPLTLSERPLPGPVTDIVLEQHQDKIQINWLFPKFLQDQKTLFQPELIKYVEIWHSLEKPGQKPFSKLAKRIKKISTKELSRDSNNKYILEIQFPPEKLDSVKHYFALNYSYQRYKPEISQVICHHAFLPAQPVSDLTIVEEGRYFILTWSRPVLNIVGKPLKELIGYQVYGQKKMNSNWEMEKQLNSDPVLREGFELQKSDSEGEFRFRITALTAPRIESDFSNLVSISLIDDMPPQAPSALVCLSNDDHIILVWEGSPDTDLKEYHVYRKQSHAEPFKLLADGVKTSSFMDYEVKRGQTYIYLVIAIDQKGNESSESNIAEGIKE